MTGKLALSSLISIYLIAKSKPILSSLVMRRDITISGLVMKADNLVNSF